MTWRAIRASSCLREEGSVRQRGAQRGVQGGGTLEQHVGVRIRRGVAVQYVRQRDAVPGRHRLHLQGCNGGVLGVSWTEGLKRLADCH